jgi:hypothetical protein
MARQVAQREGKARLGQGRAPSEPTYVQRRLERHWTLRLRQAPEQYRSFVRSTQVFWAPLTPRSPAGGADRDVAARQVQRVVIGLSTMVVPGPRHGWP